LSSIALSEKAEIADRIQMSLWSPIAHSMAIVVDNDLYYIEDVTVKGRAKRLTTSGKPGLIFNGVADWLYEGNIFKKANYVVYTGPTFIRPGQRVTKF
jgi:hypothetical protein